ncbi:putative DCC family thiol-disulfide oxidoreductase YuxK [Erwinia toletana]|uniref:DCC family thiol-disulfide oxidoreductase YuxK n=1 Tax=Winslowiella toletana TaxID=92490 RepID=A0ABS4P9I2_9GAMM|nr:thiol-disulfide oxidoreductase DCC family protein [Winslowiella toletana]MBP2168847.1 putative DCC family thiol-disulfide oxidoreductase YuxK [Winslowiella toletana]
MLQRQAQRPPAERVVLYDGLCKLCNGWANFLIRHDRQHRIRLATVQSPAGQALLHWAGLPLDNVKTIVLIDEGQIYLRATAIFRVTACLPWPWRALALLRWLPAKLSNYCYDRIAVNRYRLFGRYDSLQRPQADHPQRFLDNGC